MRIDKGMLTVTEVAQATGLTQNTIRKAIRLGRLPAEQFLDRWLIRKEDVPPYREQARVGRPKKGRDTLRDVPACP